MSEAEVTLDPLLSTAPPHDAAVVAGPIRLSTAELDARIDAMAAAFNASGVGHGDRVAFQLPTGI
nr:AMP-dependent synthetase [Actinomycetota bacterium]NIS31390.1 AMP-dependent synthetase [Actinomycetota bacterium]NIT95656.1 AMP-dependent synthetase [Actinomycetota bacterium]NIU19345.1 AMP-dependent synthetase [Actinomycetota bacterium]NIU66505.1 AMP-dependent synthetase [Actinomycetota bacterium]